MKDHWINEAQDGNSELGWQNSVIKRLSDLEDNRKVVFNTLESTISSIGHLKSIVENLEDKCPLLQEHDANREMDLLVLKEKCARIEDELYRKPKVYGGFNPVPEKKETSKECTCKHWIDGQITGNCELHQGKILSPAPENTLAEKMYLFAGGSDVKNMGFRWHEFENIAYQHYKERWKKSGNLVSTCDRFKDWKNMESVLFGEKDGK